MAKLFYFVTTLTDALGFADKNVLFDFTYFDKRQDAIQGTKSLKPSNIALVGKLELPDETEKPNQVDPGYWTQVGYNISNSKKTAQQYRLKFRRKHLSRISVVSWDKMQDDISVKLELHEKVLRGAQEIMDYDNDRRQDYDGMVANDDDRNEAFELVRKFGKIVCDYDLLRKSHGLTKSEEEKLYWARLTAIEFPLHLYAAEATRHALLAENAVIPEVYDKEMAEANRFLKVVEVLEHQQATTLRMKLGEHSMDADQVVVEIGRDEMQQIMDGEITLDELTRQQCEADGLPLPRDKPRILLPGDF